MALVCFRPTHRQDRSRPLSQHTDFDFERLPDHLFIRILHQLAFRQRFSIARVNRRFKEMSDLSVTMIESLDFDAEFPDVDTFREVVGKFARNLQVACLPSPCWRNCMAARFDAITDMEFPRLADFEIGFWIDEVPNFLAHCPNLRRLKISFSPDVTIDLGQSVFPHVESVDFELCGSTFIERVLDACPNVNHFAMDHTIIETEEFIPNLNQYFGDRVSSMESISMIFRRHLWDPPLLQHGLENFWNLRSLRILKIHLDDITFNDVNNISNSFPNLQVFRLVTERLDGGCISTLSKLKNLIDLDLFAWNGLCDIDICEFVKTSEAEGLRRFKIKGTFSLTMVKDIVERFPRLKYLNVRRLLSEDSQCAVVSNFVKQLRPFAQRDLKIVLFTNNEWLSESRRVRRAIEKIRRAAGGDERRRGLEFKMRSCACRPARCFKERLRERIARMYHRIFC